MPDDRVEENVMDGTVATSGQRFRSGLVRSIAHWLADDAGRLPFEGRLASFEGATGWRNSTALTREALQGRVVLVDFWTYTCVNWIRTLPYLRAWAAKYGDAGLTIIGVHTPEFGFEHDLDNVATQARNLGVEYPVAIDNGYRVWGAFDNHFWPAVYIADAQGLLRHHHFGEGEYAQTEMVIQRLLLDAGAESIDQNLVTVEPRGLEVAADWQTLRSPETYLGYGRSSAFASEAVGEDDRSHEYAAASSLSLNSWGLSGTWTVARHAVASDAPGARIAFRFHSRDVNLVMGPHAPRAVIPFRVTLDGLPVDGAGGSDVDAAGRGRVQDQNTYQLIRQSGEITDRHFEIEFLESGAEAYCFTFG